MQTEIRIDRDRLYQEVWAEPMSKVAPRYKISDVGLKKICGKMNIPSPPRGYWARIYSGAKLRPDPLPKLRKRDIDLYIHYHTDPPVPDSTDQQSRSIEWPDLPSEVRVKDHLRNPHPLVATTRDLLRGCKPDDYGVLRLWRESYLDLRVSPKLLMRALRIAYGLVRAFEDMGFETEILTSQYRRYPRTQVVIDGENVEFGIEEKITRQAHIPTRNESYPRKWDFSPSGILTIRIKEYEPGKRKVWRDGSNGSVEDHLLAFIEGVLTIADSKKRRSIEREETERRADEERQRLLLEHQRQETEKARTDELIGQAMDWRRSQRIRTFIEEAISRDTVPGQDKESVTVEEWAKWATEQADRMDPFCSQVPD